MAALPLIVFDVNETILDLRTMEPTFERIFGDKRDMRLWFCELDHVFRGPDCRRLHTFRSPISKLGSHEKMLAEHAGHQDR